MKIVYIWYRYFCKGKPRYTLVRCLFIFQKLNVSKRRTHIYSRRKFTHYNVSVCTVQFEWALYAIHMFACASNTIFKHLRQSYWPGLQRERRHRKLHVGQKIHWYNILYVRTCTIDTSDIHAEIRKSSYISSL